MLASLLCARPFTQRTNGQAVFDSRRLHHPQLVRSILAQSTFLSAVRYGTRSVCQLAADHVPGYRSHLLEYFDGLGFEAGLRLCVFSVVSKDRAHDSRSCGHSLSDGRPHALVGRSECILLAIHSILTFLVEPGRDVSSLVVRHDARADIR